MNIVTWASFFLIGICAAVCLTVVICVAVATRASRSGHPIAALLLSVLGFLLLAVGFGLVFFGTHVSVVEHERLDAPSEQTAYRIDLSSLSSDMKLPEPLANEPRLSANTADRNTTNTRTDQNLKIQKPESKSAGSKKKPAMADASSVAEGPIDLNHGVEIDFKARPSWVEQEDVDVGDIHQIAVCSGPYLRAREAHRELNHQLKAEADRYIDELIGHRGAAEWLGYDESELRARLVNPSNVYHEQVISSVAGIVHQSHALLEFDAKFRDEVTARWRQALATGRLAKVTLAAGLVLAVLGVLFGYFQIDTATRGFYSGRLRIGAAVVILGVVAGGILLAQSIPGIWL